MDPRQHHMGGDRTDDMGIVGDIRRAGIARPDVGADRDAGSPVGGDEAVQRGSGEVRDLGETNAAGRAVCDFAFCPDGCARHHRRPDHPWCARGFPSRQPRRNRPAASGPARPWPGEVWRPGASRLVGAEAELVAELQGRNAVGMGGHEIGRPEPGRQRQLRTVHNGTRGDRGLLAAGGTLEGEGLSAMRPSLLMGAGRTAEARRPTRGEQPSRAGGFIPVASLKVAERSREVGHDGASEAAVRSSF